MHARSLIGGLYYNGGNPHYLEMFTIVRIFIPPTKRPHSLAMHALIGHSSSCPSTYLNGRSKIALVHVNYMACFYLSVCPIPYKKEKPAPMSTTRPPTEVSRAPIVRRTAGQIRWKRVSVIWFSLRKEKRYWQKNFNTWQHSRSDATNVICKVAQ